VADGTERTLDYEDARLLNLVRSGDRGAFGVLYQRHSESAMRLARELVVSPAEIDDVVAETFARVLEVLQRGDGPTDAFRCYVLASVRRVCEGRYSDPRATGGGSRGLVPPSQHVREGSRPPLAGRPLLEPAAAGPDGALMVRAFIAQPERWSALLWHLEIEQESPDEVAPLFGLSRDGLAALERRAREGVRQACLDAYIASLSRARCIPVAERLAAYLRYQLSEPRASEVALHLSECDACRGVYAELVDLGATLRRVVAPVILGSVAASYLSSAGNSIGPSAVTATAAVPAEMPAGSGGDTVAMTTGAMTTGAMGWNAAGSDDGQADGPGGTGGTGGLGEAGDRSGNGGPGGSRRRGRLAGLSGLAALGGLAGLTGLGPSLRRHPRRTVAVAAALLGIAGGVLAITIAGQGAAQPSHDPRPLAAGSVSTAASGHTAAPSRKDTPSPSVRTRKPTPAPAAPGGTAPAPSTPSPTAAAPDVTLAVSANIFGPGRGNMTQVFFQVTDTGRASTGTLTATIGLPSGSSLASSGGGHGGSQWTCQATSSGASCQHAAISAGQQVPGGILIQLNGSAACGQPVQVTVSSGSASASAESQDIQCGQGQGGGNP
jgi:DNA-directed RNA polymerase specialized sigma24 family protein